jgi:hypothetical protein
MLYFRYSLMRCTGGAGELQVLYSAGGRDMQNSSLHDYATTGVRKWSLRKLVNWTLTT